MKDNYLDELIGEIKETANTKDSNVNIDLNNKYNYELIKQLLKVAYEDGLEEGKEIRGKEIIDMLNKKYIK